MNLLKFYPKSIKEDYVRNILNSGEELSPEKYHNKVILISFIISTISTLVFYMLSISLAYSFLVFIVMNLFFFFKKSLDASSRIKKMELIFPDVISLMASNLRSGITVDRSFLLSSRPEFAPLDGEILKTGREVATGQGIDVALKNMAIRIDSEKISKVIMLIVSGIKSGGNISDLLEQTSSNMKEKEFLEKRAASNIIMYVVFILFAVGIGAPLLFSLSSVLVEIILKLSSIIPDTGSAQIDLPFTFKSIALSPRFVIYFAVIFLIITDLISSLIIGMVNKGEGKTGLRFFIPLVAFSLTIFFILRMILTKFLTGVFSIVG